MGKLLGLDHGDKRFGIALSDAGKLIATPRLLVEGEVALWQALNSLVEEEEVEAVVIGLPLNMDGSEGPRARKVIEFSRVLEEKTGLPVHFHDERLSSFEAENALCEAGVYGEKRKSRVDMVAAQIILQGYLNQMNEEPPVRGD
ncbi:MAG: Holliday junction resolvase RuvX [Planctomycetota bacterium]|mgnify:CR=1 FL=1|nr:Holliday junction resolvase RuvX [Planctomycetota bacterium]MEC8935448.1 Holliday junction resolvase RuvX [Planctomycetota bacterium]MEE3181755.1 Holliday junction resolvase RuvX [Planctomycetota bacterium]